MFDFDGTLVDSERYFLRGLEAAMKPFGLKATRQLIEDVRARHPDELFHEILGQEKGDQAMAALKVEGKKWLKEVQPFTGVVDLLLQLRSLNVDVAIWTGRDRDSTNTILQATGIDQYVKSVVTGSCVSVNKPAKEGLVQLKDSFAKNPEEVMVVGDHSHDIRPANEIGCLSVHACWQSQPHALEEGLVPKETFHSVEEFSSWIINYLI